jgi:hypothetical protein
LSEQGDAYSAFIESELSHEHDRRDKINSQSTAVVTSSGALLTLSAGIVAFLKGKDYVPGSQVGWLFAVALVVYLGSAILGLLAGISRNYEVATSGTLDAMLRERWTDTEISAKNNVARLKLLSISSLRVGNNAKAKLLLAAVIVQVGAVVVLAVALYLAVR